jgi:hypothetical protein
MKQLMPRSVETKLTQERERRAADEPAEVLLQSAWRDTRRSRKILEPPSAGRLAFEPLDRLLQASRKRLTDHGARSDGILAREGRNVDSRGARRIAQAPQTFAV